MTNITQNFGKFATTESMKTKRKFSDQYWVNPDQDKQNREAIDKMLLTHKYVTVADAEIFEDMYPVKSIDKGTVKRYHSGKNRGDCIESILKSKVGEAYRGLVSPDWVRKSGWQADEAVYDDPTSTTYYFWKERVAGEEEEEQA